MLLGDATKAQMFLGWKAAISFDELDIKMVEYVLVEAKNEKSWVCCRLRWFICHEFWLWVLELEQESGAYALALSIATNARGDIWTCFLKDYLEILLLNGWVFKHDKCSQSNYEVLMVIHDFYKGLIWISPSPEQVMSVYQMRCY